MNSHETNIKVAKTIIVDDEAAAADELEQMLAGYSRLRLIAKINDAKNALEAIIRMKPDLVFLDIQMPLMSGFDMLDALNQTGIKPFVIFVTAFDRFAIQAIRASAFDYLLKPVDKEELALSVERFMVRFSQQEREVSYTAILEQLSGKKLRFNTTGGFVLIDPRDIIYIKADWNFSEIHLSQEKHETVAMNLGSVEEMLPQGCFARINRSVIINLTYLERVQRGKRLCVLKKDGITYNFRIPILRIRYLEGLV